MAVWIVVAEYSKVAAKRYRKYLRERNKPSFHSELTSFLLQVLNYLVRILQGLGMRKARIVQKVNVE